MSAGEPAAILQKYQYAINLMNEPFFVFESQEHKSRISGRNDCLCHRHVTLGDKELLHPRTRHSFACQFPTKQLLQQGRGVLLLFFFSFLHCLYSNLPFGKCARLCRALHHFSLQPPVHQLKLLEIWNTWHPSYSVYAASEWMANLGCGFSEWAFWVSLK